MTSLTKREHDCLYWAAHGKTSWEIGQILGISERTVNFHIANTCDKLAVRTRQAAITAAIRGDLLFTEPSTNAATTRSRPPAPEQSPPGRQLRSPPAIRSASP
ncbi:MAG TPA: helix-turn-helix domain-containing protein [Castellaniella sp.]|nr:helix-turn-helix domain-containing protein [Castellaniella sp.]